MIKGSDYLAHHGRSDVALLFQLWAEGVSIIKIAKQLGVAQSTVSRYVQHYKLPPRPPCACQQDMEAPSPEDDAASLAGLSLSPWVEERAREVRERHYMLRRGEADETARCKAASWRRGANVPRGARHDKA